MGGFKNQLTPEITTAIAEACGLGSPFKHACALAGIRHGTARGWLARGMNPEKHGGDPDGIYGEFALAVNRARAVKAQELMGKIQTAKTGGKQVHNDVRPLQWALARLYPQELGDQAESGMEEEQVLAADRIVVRLSERMTIRRLIQNLEAAGELEAAAAVRRVEKLEDDDGKEQAPAEAPPEPAHEPEPQEDPDEDDPLGHLA